MALQSHRAPRRPLFERPLFQRLRGPNRFSPSLFAKPLVGLSSRGLCSNAYEALTPQLRLSVGEAALWSLEQQPKAKGKEERNGTASEQKANSWGENLPLDGRGRPSSPKRFSPTKGVGKRSFCSP